MALVVLNQSHSFLLFHILIKYCLTFGLSVYSLFKFNNSSSQEKKDFSIYSTAPVYYLTLRSLCETEMKIDFPRPHSGLVLTCILGCFWKKKIYVTQTIHDLY